MSTVTNIAIALLTVAAALCFLRAIRPGSIIDRSIALDGVVSAIICGVAIAGVATRSGILVDIGSHQADQFLMATGATDVEVLSAQVGNVACPRHPGMQDVGQMVISGGGAIGTHRVDYLSPTGLKTWGDGRLMIVGTEGTLEVRTNVDVAGKKGKEHLIAVDGKGVRRLDAKTSSVDWAKKLVADIVEGSDTFVPQDHVRRVSELTLRAQAAASAWAAPIEEESGR